MTRPILPETEWQGPNWTYIGVEPWAKPQRWQHYIKMITDTKHDQGKYFFVYYVGRYFPQTENYFPWLALRHLLVSTDPNDVVVVLDANSEGHDYNMIKPTAERLMQQYAIPASNIILWTCGLQVDPAPIQVVQTLHTFSCNADADGMNPQVFPTHHFVMLARLPKLHRVLAAVEIIERGLLQYGKMSCGSAPDIDDIFEYFVRFVPPRLRRHFPMYLDGVVESDQENETMRMPAVTGAFCNVIAETSHEWPVWIGPSFTVPFPTEKSEKCFLLGQVPIWIGIKGQVRNIRDLGFDLFDDLIDHSYDDEPDPEKRIVMAIAQLKKICQTDLRDLMTYKLANAPRFQKNQALCLHFRQNFMQIHTDKLRNCMKQIN